MPTSKPNPGPIQRKGGFPSFCVYGRSGSGKTPQIGIWAEHMFQESGGTVATNGTLSGGLRTRLYTADRGGYDSIRPEIDLGLIELVDMRGLANPWIWMSKAIQGRVPEDLASPSGPWTREPKHTDTFGNIIGCWAFEGLTEWGDSIMSNLRDQLSKGHNIGGGAITMVEEEEDGEKFNYAFNNKSHYLIGQNRMNDCISQSMRLPGYLIWTAIDLQTSENDQARQVFGPDVGVGKKSTPKIPQKFTYTFRTVNMAKKGKDAQYRLYMATHMDPVMQNTTCICNARYHRDTPEDMKVQYVDPANIAEAYMSVKKARGAGQAAIVERLSNPTAS